MSPISGRDSGRRWSAGSPQGRCPAPSLNGFRADGAEASRLLLYAGSQARASSGALAATVGLAPAAFGSITPSWLGFDTPESDPGAEVPEGSRLAAVLSRSDMLRAVAAYDQAEAGLKLETARQYPALRIGPGYTWERGLVKLRSPLGWCRRRPWSSPPVVPCC